MSEAEQFAIVCGHCNGSLYMETCNIPGHDWAVASECQTCGARYVIDGGCLDCGPNKVAS